MQTLAQRVIAQAWVPDRFAHIVTFLRHQSLLEPSHRNLAALVALRASGKK